MADEGDAVAVAAALRAWLEREHGGVVAIAEPPSTDTTGRATIVHMVRFTGSTLPVEWQRPLVVRIHRSPADDAASAREAQVQEWCVERRYPVPRVIARFAPGGLLDLPVQVVERAPGITMLDAVRKAPWRAPALIDRLASLQLRLHALPIDGWPEGPEPRLVDRRLQRTRRMAPHLGDPDLGNALAKVDALLPRLRDAPTVPCHGDFHPLNVLVASGQATVIDWTDAAIGDRHGDVSRTLFLISFGLTMENGMNRAARRVLNEALTRLAARYLRAYEAACPLDHTRLRHWEVVQFVDLWCHIDEAIAQRGEGPTHEDHAALEWVRSQVAAALAV